MQQPGSSPPTVPHRDSALVKDGRSRCFCQVRLFTIHTIMSLKATPYSDHTYERLNNPQHQPTHLNTTLLVSQRVLRLCTLVFLSWRLVSALRENRRSRTPITFSTANGIIGALGWYSVGPGADAVSGLIHQCFETSLDESTRSLLCYINISEVIITHVFVYMVAGIAIGYFRRELLPTLGPWIRDVSQRMRREPE